MFGLLSYIILLFAIGLAIASIRRPGYSLTLVLSVYALEQSLQSSIPIFLQRSYLVNVGVALVVGIAAMRNWLNGGVKLSSIPRAYYAVLTLYGFAYLSCSWSPVMAFSFENFERFLPYWIAGVFIPPFLVKDSKDLEHAMEMLVWFGSLIVLDLVTKQYVGRSVFLGSIGREDALGNPLATSTFAGYVAIATAFRLYIGRPKLLKMSAYIGITLIALYAIVISGSRGQLLAVAAAGMIWLPLTARIVVKKSLLGGLALAAFICIAGFILVDYSGFAYRWERETVTDNVGYRFDRAQSLLNVYFHSDASVHFLGLGSSASYKYFETYSHVVPAEVLAELGLFAFVVFAWFLYRAIETAYRFMIERSIPYDERVQMGTLAGMLTFDFLLFFKLFLTIQQLEIFFFPILRTAVLEFR